MKRLVVVLAGLAAAFTFGGVASAAPPLAGTLTLTPAAVTAGDSAVFTADIDGKVPRDSRVEVSVACFDAGGSMVLQGAIAPGRAWVVAVDSGSSCLAALRVVEMRKSGVTVLDQLSFPVG